MFILNSFKNIINSLKILTKNNKNNKNNNNSYNNMNMNIYVKSMHFFLSNLSP